MVPDVKTACMLVAMTSLNRSQIAVGEQYIQPLWHKDCLHAFGHQQADQGHTLPPTRLVTKRREAVKRCSTMHWPHVM